MIYTSRKFSPASATCFRAVIIALLASLSACQTTPPAPEEEDPSLDIVVPTKLPTDAEAMTMEFDLMSSPKNMQTRVNLLWHYRGQFGNAEAERQGNKHVLWLIEREPRAAVLASPVAQIAMLPDRTAFDEAKDIWLRILDGKPKDARILGNAGVFFMQEDTARAIPLLEQAARLDPEEATWPRHLGEGYRAQALAAEGGQREVLARLATTMYERAAARSASALEKAMMLTSAAGVARLQDDNGAAATELLNRAAHATDKVEPGPDQAALMHSAFVLRGLLMIDSKDTPAAKPTDLLRAAAETIRGQTIPLTDLDMSLAAALLDRGEKDAVAAYLETVEKVSQSAEVARWRQAMSTGEKPDFSSYMH